MAATSKQPLLNVIDLCKVFPIYKQGITRRQVGAVNAVDHVNFTIVPGETLGLVGESGSGKTTTGRAILRAFRPSSGQVLFRPNGHTVDLAQVSENDLRPLRSSMQMIFQDPYSSLNPRMTVRDTVAEPLVINKLASGKELERRVDEMLEMVGLSPEHRTRYPQAFSGGQRQRIGIARALVMRPSFVVCDEPVSALDVSVQAQIVNLLMDLQTELGLTYLFISHDLSIVRHICDRIAVMYSGRIMEIAPTAALFQSPRHPYTQVLLAAKPKPDPDDPMDFEMLGKAGEISSTETGCPFAPRCPMRQEICARHEQTLREVGENHEVACCQM